MKHSNSSQTIERDTLIVGGGFGGLGMALTLLRQQNHSFILLEAEDGLGGTWRVNTYPGAACDVQSHLYSYSFAPRADWSRTFAGQSEILKYIETVSDKAEVRRYCRFGERVISAVWQADTARWLVKSDRGTTISAKYLVNATGGLSQPLIPRLDGLESFEGDLFHSAQWRHDVDLSGKRVGVIGTAASAVQIIPEIADQVSSLHVFQRTAHWVLPRLDYAYPDWLRESFKRVPALRWLERQRIYWSLEPRVLAFASMPKALSALELVARAHLLAQVRSPKLRQKLSPTYKIGCKRVLMSNTYYKTLERPHVSLQTEAIRGITPRGIELKGGRTVELDVIVMATGFHAAEAAPPYDIIGSEGTSLADFFKPYPRAYKGTVAPGFPNLFMIIGPNTGLGHSSMIHIIESQIAYIMDALRWMRSAGVQSVDVKPDALEGWNAWLQEKLEETVWAVGCEASWYKTADGVNTTLWPGSTISFRRHLRRFDSENYSLAPAC